MKTILILIALTCGLTVLRAQEYQALFGSGTVDLTLSDTTLSVTSGSYAFGSADGVGSINLYDNAGDTFPGTIVLNTLSFGMSTGEDSLGNDIYPISGYAILTGQEVTDLGNGFLSVGVSTPEGLPPTTFASVEAVAVAAPEPSTWAMMIAGLALLGFCARRKLV